MRAAEQRFRSRGGSSEAMADGRPILMATLNMSANYENELLKQTKNGKPESHRSSVHSEGSSQVYVGNLTPGVSEEEIWNLFKDFNPQHVRKIQSGVKCFAFVDVGSVETQQLVISKFHGTKFSGRRLVVNRAVLTTNERKSPEHFSCPVEMPALEMIPSLDCNEQLTFTSATDQPNLSSGEGIRTPSPAIVTAEKAYYAVPLEMRSFSLVNLLKDCFQNLNWLTTISRLGGEAGLLVTDTVPQSPFFWAMYLTEEVHLNMLKLFKALAEAESQQPFLQRRDVQRGMRCMAECNLGDGNAWNRCWVMDVIEDFAVVVFVDFGRSATVLAKSLRVLDRETFWTIPPLAQPFMLLEEKMGDFTECMFKKILDESLLSSEHLLRASLDIVESSGIFNSKSIIGSILTGRICGPYENECHILKFSKSGED